METSWQSWEYKRLVKGLSSSFKMTYCVAQIVLKKVAVVGNPRLRRDWSLNPALDRSATLPHTTKGDFQMNEEHVNFVAILAI